MSEINDIEEIPEGYFPIHLKLIQQHHHKDPILMAKYTEGTYHKGCFCGGSNIYLTL